MGAKWLNLTGNQYGLLTVLGEGERGKYGQKQWRCKCICGNEINVQTSYLKSGHTQSCGCLLKKTITKHGYTGTRVYSIWQNMKARCYQTSHKGYNLYGGRGITVCDEWKNDAKAFCDWAMNNGYSDELELDRIDNNGNYTPSNCRWVTHAENNRNKSTNHFITFKSETHTICEWEKITGIANQEIYRRLKLGWPIEKALTQPVMHRK